MAGHYLFSRLFEAFSLTRKQESGSKSRSPVIIMSSAVPPRVSLLPVLYMLYLAELIAQDPTLHFWYADNICLYHATKLLDTNVEQLATEVQSILAYGTDNKIFFTPEKLKMIHLTKKSGDYAPLCIVNDNLTIYPLTTAPRKVSSLPSTGVVSGSIKSSHSSAMLQKEPQKPVKSRTTSEALPQPRMDRRPPACIKQSLTVSYLQHSMALKCDMWAIPNHQA